MLATMRCTGSATVRKPTLGRRELGPPEPSERARVAPREVYWPELGRKGETPIFRAEYLAPGNVIVGPAVIEPTVTTIVIRPGQTARIDDFGNVIVSTYDEKGEE